MHNSNSEPIPSLPPFLRVSSFCSPKIAVRDFTRNMIKNPFPFMSLRVARGIYNPEKDRFNYYVSFKPTLDPTTEERGTDKSYPIEVALSVTETGELADL